MNRVIRDVLPTENPKTPITNQSTIFKVKQTTLFAEEYEFEFAEWISEIARSRHVYVEPRMAVGDKEWAARKSIGFVGWKMNEDETRGQF